MSSNGSLGILKNPYPFYYDGLRVLTLMLVIFVTSLYITYVLTPHHIDYSHLLLPYFWICVVHAAVPALIFAMWSLLVKLLVDTNEWTLGREFGFIVVLLLLVGLGNFLVRDLIYDSPNNWSLPIFWEEISNTFSIGVLVAAIIVSINYKFRTQQHQKRASKIKPLAVAEPNQVIERRIAIETNLKNESFKLDLDRFIFAKADGNYTEIHLHESAGPHKLLKRISLSRFLQLLEAHQQVVRVHKSYVVNLTKVADCTGNAAGLKLLFKGLPEVSVPVSRKNIRLFEERMQLLTVG
ncbi:MAG: LytTR family DNA-binding domain-containing protein [Bacteroidota bacterium]